MAAPPNRVFVITLVLSLGFLAAMLVLPFASFVLMGLLAVYFVHPIYVRVTKRLGWPRVTAVLFLLLLFLLIVAPFAYVGWVLVREGTALVATLDPETTHDAVQDALVRLFGAFGQEVPASLRALDAGGALEPVQRFVGARLPGALAFLAHVVLGTFVMAFVFYYALLQADQLVAYVRSVVPLSNAHTQDLVEEVRKVVEAVFLGQLVAALSQGIIALVGFIIFGVPHPLFWAFVLAIFALIPFVGSAVVWVPAVFYLLLNAPTWKAVSLLLYCLILVINVDNLVKPYIVGSRSALHPVLVLIGILGGLLLFGPIGFVVGPLVLALFVAVLNFWREDYLPHYRSG